MQQKRSLIFQGFSRKVDNFYRFSVQLNAEFRYNQYTVPFHLPFQKRIRIYSFE